MICYLVRHGKDDDSVRGGWGSSKLTSEGIQQSLSLADYIFENQSMLNIKRILSSDLVRARQTAECISNKLGISIELRKEFRETNNGILAGMPNDIATKQYPNLFWDSLEWDECYPDGESPKLFYDRIYAAWNKLLAEHDEQEENIILITHGGVINAILKIDAGEIFSNKDKSERICNAKLIPMIVR